ncbi:hypothetical protein D9M71_750550 [compost metagenome]
MGVRHHALEAGVNVQLSGLVAEQHRQEETQRHEEQSVVENQALNEVAGANIELGSILQHRCCVVFYRFGHLVFPLIQAR